MSFLNRLKEERENILTQQRRILNTAEHQKRDLTADETTQYAAMDRDFESLTRQIEGIEETRRNDKIISPRENPSFSHDLNLRVEGGAKGEIRTYPPNSQRPYHQTHSQALTPDDERDIIELLRRGPGGLYPETRRSYDRRALQMDLDVQGGFLVLPESYGNRIIAAIDSEVFMRQFSTIFQLSYAQSLSFPQLNHDPAAPTWSAEIKTGSADATMDLTKRTLTPHSLAKRILISNTLIQRSPTVLDFVRGRLSYVFATTFESAYLTGNGAGQPLGVFTASDDGVPTSRDVSTGNTTTLIKADNLIETCYSLKSGYLKNARWIFHRDAMKQIRRLKDGEGNYLWQSGLASNRPQTLLDLPVHLSEFAPNTFTSGQYVGIVGDFGNYYIADCLTMQISVLSELYAETNQSALICRWESDGMPVIGEAFARVTLA